MTFAIGNKVRFTYDDTIGEVLEVRDDNVSTGAKYLIKWNGSPYAPDWTHGDNLILVNYEEDARVAGEIQSMIDEAQTALEKAWESFSAAKEAAYKHHSSLSSMQYQGLVDLGKFRVTAENFGWSSSSLSCS